MFGSLEAVAWRLSGVRVAKTFVAGHPLVKKDMQPSVFDVANDSVKSMQPRKLKRRKMSSDFASSRTNFGDIKHQPNETQRRKRIRIDDF